MNLLSPSSLRSLENRIISLKNYIFPESSLPETFEPSENIRVLRNYLRVQNNPDLNWLFLCAIAGGMPDVSEFAEFQGVLNISLDRDDIEDLLFAASPTALRVSQPAEDLIIFENSLIVDVDFSAKHSLNTGIQRVTRNTVQRWEEFTPVVWDDTFTYMRQLNSEELGRLNPTQQPVMPGQCDENVMVLPYKSTLFWPEVPSSTASRNISALAAQTNTLCIAIGYDFIPVTSAVEVTPADTDRFTSYLSTVKYFDKVLAISDSTNNEFSGFNRMLAAQGLSGPEILTISLPMEQILPASEKHNSGDADVPMILTVGTLEPRKNQKQVLESCEELWTSGYDFSLVFVGNASPHLSVPFLVAVKNAKKNKRKVEVKFALPDSELNKLYDQALVSVFISTHEGYGLPVAESLAHGTPVITSNYGSLIEVAAGHNAVLVDPRTKSEITSAIQTFLDGNAQFNAESSPLKFASKTRSWGDYSQQILRQVSRD